MEGHVEPRLPAWWLEEALAAEGTPEPAPALDHERVADVCVVGGGFTGLWTALAVRERAPSASIVVLEAEICGAGPSGRNGGFVHGFWPSLGALRAAVGDADAVAVAQAGDGILPAIRALDEDVWLREAGMLQISAAPAQDAAIAASVAAARELGVAEQARSLTSAEVAARVQSPAFRAGVHFPEGGTVHPGRLVRALRRRVLAAGVPIYERTRAVEVAPGYVRAPVGVVRAPEIVLATNAALTGWGHLRRRLTNFGSYVVLTEPVPELLEAIGWTGGEAVIDGRMFLHYFRTTPDGRVLMGSASGPIGFGGRVDGRFSADRPTVARAEAGLRRLLPGLSAARVERAWGGPIDVSSDHLPFFGTVPGTRIHFGAGYSGNGVGPSWVGGQTLASLVTGTDDDWTRSPLVTRPAVRLPPEPLRFLGGALVRAAIMACETAEEEERRPPLAARAGAAVPRLLHLRIGTR
jgi:glycine/D-amino acid oxidase-like deaminating enzyme